MEGPARVEGHLSKLVGAAHHLHPEGSSVCVYVCEWLGGGWGEGESVCLCMSVRAYVLGGGALRMRGWGGAGVEGKAGEDKRGDGGHLMVL